MSSRSRWGTTAPIGYLPLPRRQQVMHSLANLHTRPFLSFRLPFQGFVRGHVDGEHLSPMLPTISRRGSADGDGEDGGDARVPFAPPQERRRSSVMSGVMGSLGSAAEEGGWAMHMIVGRTDSCWGAILANSGEQPLHDSLTRASE
jgi:hypothetical protein